MFQSKQFKVRNKKNVITIKMKLGKNEELNERELQIFQRRILRGILRPEVPDRKHLEYIVPKSIPLKKYLKRGISKQQFFQTFVQLLEITILAESSGLNRNNLVFNLDYVYINESANAVQMIYLPIFTQNVSSNIFSFLYDMIHTSVFLLNDDMHIVNDLMEYMHQMQQYSAEEIEDYIEKVYPEVFKSVIRYNPEENQKQQFVEKKQEVITEQRTQSNGMKWETLTVNNFYDREAALLNERVRREVQAAQRAFLAREKDGRKERIPITKQEFWIGVEYGKVDYCIANNRAISRRHAVIKVKGANYFIQDNASTNKTYVNRKEAVAGQEIQLADGDSIMLANETFKFHIS